MTFLEQSRRLSQGVQGQVAPDETPGDDDGAVGAVGHADTVIPIAKELAKRPAVEALLGLQHAEHLFARLCKEAQLKFDM